MLSLNRSYDAFVVPRLDNFERQHPDVRTVTDLLHLMATYPSADAFVSSALNYRHPERAAILQAVLRWLATISGNGSPAEQLSNLEHWAKNARPQDSLALPIKGFGLAGFQYLRMLFGGNTTKPDIHICGFVAECVGHAVTNLRALQLLEPAAKEAGISLRDFDTTVWERSARAAS